MTGDSGAWDRRGKVSTRTEGVGDGDGDGDGVGRGGGRNSGMVG